MGDLPREPQRLETIGLARQLRSVTPLCRCPVTFCLSKRRHVPSAIYPFSMPYSHAEILLITETRRAPSPITRQRPQLHESRELATRDLRDNGPEPPRDAESYRSPRGATSWAQGGRFDSDGSNSAAEEHEVSFSQLIASAQAPPDRHRHPTYILRHTHTHTTSARTTAFVEKESIN